MIDPESVPAPSAPPEHHADFLELVALRNPQRRVSFQDFARDMRMTGATEALRDSDDSEEVNGADDRTEALVEAAFDELDRRRAACGATKISYPFAVDGGGLLAEPGHDGSIYTFLALLSWYGKDKGPPGTDGEKLFEEIAAKTAEAYLGGPASRVHSYVFGFPRRLAPAGFSAALDDLCKQLREGGGHHRGRPTRPDQKDAKLDVVAWVDFADQREGKAIIFGQCATGANWKGKLSELPEPSRWCSFWMADQLVVPPTKSFFVPHRVEADQWTYSGTFGGLLYDRCRIASLAGAIDGPLQQRVAEWSTHVLAVIRA